MLFLWFLSVVLSIICTVSGGQDQKCIDDNCSCCVDRVCGSAQGFNNACTKGCIDGHRGARCYELCQYPNCKSCGGTGPTSECTKCYDGYYLGSNIDCTSQCPSNCKSCTSSTMCTECKEGFYDKDGSTTCPYAHCPANCECTEGQGDCVSCKEGFYDTSTTCSKQCPVNCLTCESKESCIECKHGFYNGYENDNSISPQTNRCAYPCRDTCTQCQSYTNCSQCKESKYGGTCQEDCSVGCKDKTCSFDLGECECTTNYTGDKCMKCNNGNYGQFCNQTCHKDCKGQICERQSGDCTDGCINANITGKNCSLCKVGMYGELCNMVCPKNCKNNVCKRDSGICSDGCIGNFNGTQCKACKNGNYGENCDRDCPVQCKGNICEKGSGDCYDCNVNFQGKKCEDCKLTFYGPNCDEQCSPYCANSTCDRNTGKCIYGCLNGYSGDRCCVMSENCVKCDTNEKCKTCVPGFFKTSCNETCPGGCNSSCDILTGECILDKNGPTDEALNLAVPIAGSVAGLVVIVMGIFAVVLIWRRRKRKDSRNENNTKTALSSKRTGEHVVNSKEGPLYANVKDKKAQAEDLEEVVLDESNENDEDAAAEYYNCDSVNMNVKVAELFSYVTKEHVEFFKNEFKSLPKPDDLTMLCKVAKKTENAASNRYNGIYPFDHSRVTIPEEPGFYINACYIDGYNRSKAYVASIGPTAKTTETFRTFWRMVWHEKSDIIVMLTNLHETSGMKCEQYWPNKEMQESYGHVKVKCRSEEVFAEYTVRSFTVSKGKEQRNLTQLHFTAWPDKGVPSEVTSLVDFRQRVKAAPVVLDGPVIVHCSAGIGRTGTYIALDILSEQGKAEDSINVFNTVSTMRGQRLNMVQTAEQYMFLHKALVHTLTFGCESLTAEELQAVAFDTDDKLSAMLQTLAQEVDHETEEDIAAREENKKKYADKSRGLSDIPGNCGRVRLYLSRKAGNSDYINAVFIDSFKVANLFIAAQTPQSNTVEDFLCMIYQQNSYCVVSFEDPLQLSQKHDIGVYLPSDSETLTCGNFTVKCSDCEIKPQYTMKKLTIKHTDKGEEKIAYHFQYTKWGNGQKVAESPGEFVQLVKDVEAYVNQRVVDMPNIAVHCLNGYERSGLFCVVYTLLEKLEAERQVSVVNVIRRVRKQRKRSISSVEQLKFCYQCISAYLESYNIYSNFAV